MYFRTRVKFNTVVKNYTWLSMVAEIGGNVGLFLGIAVVDLNALLGRRLLQRILD